MSNECVDNAESVLQVTMGSSIRTGVPTSQCQRFGFACQEARNARLFQAGLEHSDPMGRVLQELIIGPHIDTIIDRFYQHLWQQPEASALLQSHSRIARLKGTQRAHLLMLGIDYGDEPYFESRLRVGIAHSRIGLPLALYQTSYGLLQRLLVEMASSHSYEDPQILPPLLQFIVQITTLDMSLAIEAYEIDIADQFENRVECLQKESEGLRVEVDTDALTGATSRRSLLAFIEHLAQRKGSCRFAVIIADVDYFKQVNDQYGHIAGDAVLSEVVSRFRSTLRNNDVLGRYGGDELVAVLVDADATAARAIAERVRRAICDAPIHIAGHTIDVTLSLGVTVANRKDTHQTVIDRADQALYGVKRDCRNAVGYIPSRKLELK